MGKSKWWQTNWWETIGKSEPRPPDFDQLVVRLNALASRHRAEHGAAVCELMLKAYELGKADAEARIRELESKPEE